MDTQTILLAVLTTVLSIFLLVGITVGIFIIKLINTVRRVADKAESVIDSVETAAELVTETTGKLSVLKLVSNIIKLSQKKGR